MLSKINKRSVGLIVFPIVLWLLNFIYGKQFFGTVNLKTYIALKCLLLLFLYGVEGLTVWIVRGISEKNEATKVFLRTFLLVMCVYIVWLIASWPGGWGNDGYVILGEAKNMSVSYWTSLLTSVEYLLAVMIFPSPNSVLILQIFLCAIIEAGINFAVYNITGSKRMAYWGLIPFLMPVVIMYVLSPVRAILFALLALWVCVQLMHLIHLKEKVSWLQLLLFAGGVALVAFWRSEGCLLILLIPFYVVSLHSVC